MLIYWPKYTETVHWVLETQSSKESWNVFIIKVKKQKFISCNSWFFLDRCWIYFVWFFLTQYYSNVNHLESKFWGSTFNFGTKTFVWLSFYPKRSTELICRYFEWWWSIFHVLFFRLSCFNLFFCWSWILICTKNKTFYPLKWPGD